MGRRCHEAMGPWGHGASRMIVAGLRMLKQKLSYLLPDAWLKSFTLLKITKSFLLRNLKWKQIAVFFPSNIYSSWTFRELCLGGSYALTFDWFIKLYILWLYISRCLVINTYIPFLSHQDSVYLQNIIGKGTIRILKYDNIWKGNEKKS